jgi:hypothetical protein
MQRQDITDKVQPMPEGWIGFEYEQHHGDRETVRRGHYCPECGEALLGYLAGEKK